MQKVKIKYIGIDDFNRPVYKDINSNNYYGSTNVLLPSEMGAPNNTTKEINDYFRKNIFDLCYFGTSRNCEPYGGMPKGVELEIVPDNFIFIKEEKYNSLHKDLRGVYSSDDIHNTNWNGKRTMLANENGETVLLIEDVSFKIIK